MKLVGAKKAAAVYSTSRLKLNYSQDAIVASSEIVTSEGHFIGSLRSRKLTTNSSVRNSLINADGHAEVYIPTGLLLTKLSEKFGLSHTNSSIATKEGGTLSYSLTKTVSVFTLCLDEAC